MNTNLNLPNNPSLSSGNQSTLFSDSPLSTTIPKGTTVSTPSKTEDTGNPLIVFYILIYFSKIKKL